MLTMITDYAIDLGIDLVAITLLAYVLYFRRHRRADLLLSYVALNLGIFMVMSVLGTVRLDVAVGFGLFAILSIIRLRSTSVTQQEVAYYFVALVLGLVNGLDVDNRPLVILINVVLLAAMAGVDSRQLRDSARRLDITLDWIHADEASLVADLERRLGGKVLHHEVNEIDHSRGTMLVDVRYKIGPERTEPALERRMEVTLDTVHGSDAELVADLERRVGGRVLQHRVREVDYVRDVTVVDVRAQVGRVAHDPRYAGPPAQRHNGAVPGPPPGAPWAGGPQNGPGRR